ncbi:MAG: hypothetical protein EXQ87_08275 [Alphaproteobacteria bacterium]|nr:hypothetical protein [Alphaproteobacteria bacterium]
MVHHGAVETDIPQHVVVQRHEILLHDQHDDDDPPDWPDWPAWLQGAVAGQGVASARTALVADDIAAGRLARPFALALPSDWAYWFLCEQAAAERPKIRAFQDWLMAGAEYYRDDQGGRP